jgi:hypothetical protein
MEKTARERGEEEEKIIYKRFLVSASACMKEAKKWRQHDKKRQL